MRSIRKAEVRIFSHVDRTNWSIRALLYSHNQRQKTEAFSKFSTGHSVSSLNAVVGREIFPVPSHISFKVKLSIKKSKTCIEIVIPFVFVY